MDATEEQLLTTNTEGDIITANGEIVGDLVMQDGDPSVIVESIVNADGSVFVDERDFNNYCNNHLTHDSNSPGPQGTSKTVFHTFSEKKLFNSESDFFFRKYALPKISTNFQIFFRVIFANIFPFSKSSRHRDDSAASRDSKNIASARSSSESNE